MFVYYNLNSLEIENINILDKVKNKTSNGNYYKLIYSTKNFTLDSIIIKVNLENKEELNNFLLFEKTLTHKINIENLNPTFNFNNFVSKYKKSKVYIKICGIYSNNYNYGLIYKLINCD